MVGTESSTHQERAFMSANIGDNVTLHCFYEDKSTVTFYWYKQPLGDRLQLISSIYVFNPSEAVLYNEFMDDKRFSVEGGQGRNHLTISDVKLSDSATYVCGGGHSNMIVFRQGAILHVKAFSPDSGSIYVLQQPVSESVQPGDSVTLNCTINTETCAGEHSVYWFRHGSGQSHPGIIYTHGDRSGQCKNSTETGSPTQSCVYNLPKRNLSLSDAGTYYCAVVSCGEILFGNGTKMEVKDRHTEPVLLVFYLGIALGVSFILNIVLICIIYKINLMLCQNCRDLVFACCLLYLCLKPDHLLQILLDH
ncbi:hypothetical protein DPEC_G00104060 [Dallia pectoralis]|uniref:Uncharacterized protein n=1 Tax=Dallia pectoralis TaxID=75939 RepID=A0ACC2GXC3_DALPE|nr:hypothetical protein DPEC_G00104060 [Dallia pectoralis]